MKKLLFALLFAVLVVPTWAAAGYVVQVYLGSGSVSNTTSETSLISSSSGSRVIDLTALIAGDRLHVRASGDIDMATSSATVRVRVRMGNSGATNNNYVLVMDSGAMPLGVVTTDRRWVLDGYLIAETVGGSGGFRAEGALTYEKSPSVGADARMAPLTTTSTLDTTDCESFGISCNIDITAQWSAADPNNIITMDTLSVAVVER